VSLPLSLPPRTVTSTLRLSPKMLLLSGLVKAAATPGLQVVLLPAQKLLPLLLQPLQPPLLKLLPLLHPLAPLNYLVTPVLLMPSPLVLV
ncbi:hypothetical protein AWRI1631_155300, partial [Saccharomyces cerevisiae AWRI1631]